MQCRLGRIAIEGHSHFVYNMIKGEQRPSVFESLTWINGSVSVYNYRILLSLANSALIRCGSYDSESRAAEIYIAESKSAVQCQRLSDHTADSIQALF